MLSKNNNILYYIEHFLYIKKILQKANRREPLSESICRAIFFINFSKQKINKNVKYLSNEEIIKYGKPANLLKVANLINCPRETVRRKFIYLYKNRLTQYNTKHKVYITKKWINQNYKDLNRCIRSLKLISKKII